MLVGGSEVSVSTVFAALGAESIHTARENTYGWIPYEYGNGNTIHILDARTHITSLDIEKAITLNSPDLILAMEQTMPDPEGWNTSRNRMLACPAAIIGISCSNDFLGHFSHLLKSDADLSAKTITTIELADISAPEILCAALPLPAQLEFARFTNARKAQALIASSLLKSFGAICGIIALQPIPLADLPILLTLQSLMVGLIIHTTGRPPSKRLIVEFLGALGIGAAAGFAFREVARVAVRIVPFWGNAVSGLVAGAGTYAIGRAAIAYFIDDSPLEETRRLFKKILRSGKNPPARM
jgi:uncharacterized protein (DUF697 family)